MAKKRVEPDFIVEFTHEEVSRQIRMHFAYLGVCIRKGYFQEIVPTIKELIAARAIMGLPDMTLEQIVIHSLLQTEI